VSETIVSVRGIGKSFGATRALEGVSFDFKKGEILALVGANGAGKSTLIKIICGYYQDYQGELLVGGERVSFQSPKDAYRKGIQTVHQIINQGVVQNMTVAENLALEYLLSSECDFFIKKEAVLERAAEIASRMDLKLDLRRQVAELGQSDRQLLVIARNLASDPKLLILDEPTSSLSERETAVLFDKLARLRAEGVAILYVSHRLHEIRRIADRVGVIRDGKLSAVLEKPFDVKQIVTAMVGQVREHDARAAGAARDRGPRLEL
jgi:simple sugar transport system ATP-binding protein